MNVPNHIAIILDGNGRWAKAKGLPRGYGHVKGCANLEQVCYDIKDLGVKYLTVYAFSRLCSWHATDFIFNPFVITDSKPGFPAIRST